MSSVNGRVALITTPLVRESKADLATAREMLATLPAFLGKTTSVQKCAEAFVEGIEGRKRQVNCPGWIELFRWLKPLLTSGIGEGQARKTTPDTVPRMDAEVAALGRSMSARTEALEEH
jgi:hypothetical protein